MKLKGLFLITPFLLSGQGHALTPMAQVKLLNKLKATSHRYIYKRTKTNAKGTILEATASSFSAPENWFNLDPELDDVQGVSSERVYQEFGIPTQSEDIIVAVIDSGVDVNHEDLQGKIWINEDEIANNGIDDDNNGYVDDVFGWNFIGAKDGMATIETDNSIDGIKLVQGDPSKQVHADTLVITREYVRLKKLKEQVESQGGKLPNTKLELLKKIEQEVKTQRTDALDSYNFYKDNITLYKSSEKVLKEEGGLTQITYEDVEALNANTETLALAKKNMIELLDRGLSIDYLESELKYYDTLANFYYNPASDTRADIVGDNYTDVFESQYGNNNVIGPDAFHGTHVAGIIAADRNNNIGIKGVAEKVKIMAIRCVPDGDERDKDVANSIRYAVDNGAKIINMSFGKDYSPYKKAVNAAVKYAEEKGVLLVHAAGNSYQNNDTENSFPNRKLHGREATNWLEIGASSFKKSSSLAAGFSNYGQKTVDFFAPGSNLNSTIPGNGYDYASGTSMASPVVSGVAALTLSFNNKLSTEELRDVIINTTNRYPKLYVYKARLGKVLFSSLSIHGGIPNAFNAVQAVIEKKNEEQVITPPRRRGGFLGMFRRNK